MSFKDLYDYCQTLSTPISRKKLKKKILELADIDGFLTVKTTMDPKICKGYYLSARNTEHRIVKQNGYKTVIVLSRDLNECWARFVSIKEMMHIFDDPIETTKSSQNFERLLTELTTATSRVCPQTYSEFKCFLMALALICPESERLELQRQRRERLIDDYGIALKLKMPEKHVAALFDADLRDEISHLLEETPAQIIQMPTASSNPAAE